MSDTFWVQLFGFMAIMGVGWFKHLADQKAARLIMEGQKLVEDKVDINTDVTTTGAQAAKEAAAKAVEAKEELSEKVDQANVAMNGRMTQLVESVRQAAHAEGLLEGTSIRDGIVNRIATLEGGHEVLVQGQVETNRKIDKLADAVNNVGVEVRRQSKH